MLKKYRSAIVVALNKYYIIPIITSLLIFYVAQLIPATPVYLLVIIIVVNVIAFLFFVRGVLYNEKLKTWILWYAITYFLIVIAGIIGYVIIQVLLEVLNQGVPKELIAVLITAIATISAVVGGNIYKSKLDLQQEILKSKVFPIYESLIDLLIDNRNKNLKEKTKQINELDKEINKWGYYKVKYCWHTIQPKLLLQEVFDDEMQTEIIKLVSALRKQVGLPDESETQLKKLLDYPEI